VVSIRKILFSIVILRISAMGGTTKNLEILRGVYPFDRLRAGFELAERLRMTKLSFRMNTN